MIVVFGSVNIDLVAAVAHLPAPGETVIGPGYAVHPGGKGANQALAARRAGAEVALVGAVGQDGFATPALALLSEAGVDLADVARVEVPTGAAFIAVDAAGANQIVVGSGANGLARADAVVARALRAGDTLLLQCEVPEAQCLIAARTMKRSGGRVVLNLAPAMAPDPELLAMLDILVVNEHEARVLGQALGLELTEPDAIARAVDARLGIACVVTLGADGVVAWRAGERLALPAPAVVVVDTVAAGDSFVGAFAAALDAGRDFATALRHGLCAGSLACTVAGAQPGIPAAAAIAELLQTAFD